MTKCCMTGKIIKCNYCGKSDVAIEYCEDITIISCRNSNCNETWKISSVTYNYSDPKYPTFFGSVENNEWLIKLHSKKIGNMV